MIKALCMLLAVLVLSACAGTQQAASAVKAASGLPSGSRGGSAASEPQAFASSSQVNAASAAASSAGSAASAPAESALLITVGDQTLTATFANNPSAEAFRDLLAQGPLTLELEDYGGFEKVGPLGTALPQSDTQITTVPGDIILYQGDQITIYYDTNTWRFTRLARIDDPSGLRELLGDGRVTVTFSLA